MSRLAEYCKVKLMTINGPDVYGSSLGESEERLRDKFNEAKGIAETSKSGCILFIDELVYMLLFLRGDKNFPHPLLFPC